MQCHLDTSAAHLPPISWGTCRKTCPPRSRPCGPAAEPQRKFSDFLSFRDDPPPRPSPADVATLGTKGAAELVDRAASVVAAAREALESVRQREPADSRNRRTGPEIRAVEPQQPASGPPGAAPSRSGGSGSWDFGSGSYGGDEDEEFGGASGPSFSASFGGAGFGGGAPGLVDSWFASKVDTGPMAVLQRSGGQPMGRPAAAAAAGVAILERPVQPQTLAFGGAPAAAAAEPAAEGSIFPASLQLRFETEMAREAEAATAVEAEMAAAAAAAAAGVTAPAEAPPQPEGEWEQRSGEERGPGGYWYRWTEARGRDATGKVQWFERWWEASDWAGMRELGAEKWGANANGDAWRETWREALTVEGNGQPWVERSAHKWARNHEGAEWEEKWGEQYYSGGRVDKWADKWGREGSDIWHEKWGELYDGSGGCTKYTDKWAERQAVGGGNEQWGDKWEENFKDGRGEKKGETWSIGADGRRYNRWWGENHYGDGWVQKFGNSTDGEHWDVTEQSGTYYNCNPHFNYAMALYHSPVLRNVPVAPREGAGLELELGGGGNGGRSGLGSGFGALL